MTPGIIRDTFIFILGLAVGSFLNVCIYRLPRSKSIIRPSSFCPRCGKAIFWYDNIPLLSYLILGGRCRFCQGKISFRYFAVELLTGVIFLFLFTSFPAPLSFIYILLSAGLVVASFIDLEHQIIPDEISLGGLGVGLFLSFIYPPLHGFSGRWSPGAAGSSFLAALLAGLAGGVLIWTIGFLGKIVFRREAMGEGDVKFLAMIGSFLGWKMTLLVFLLAPVLGSVVGIVLKIKYRAEVVPYGPFLALAALVAMVWGEKIIGFYQGLF